MGRLKNAWMVGCAALALGSGCDRASQPIESSEFALQTVTSCADLEQEVRNVALKQMRERLQRQLEEALGGSLGGCYADAGMAMPAPSAPPPSAPAPAPAPSNPSAPKQTSGTNNQVAGVDEADFIKHDGKHIYVASGESFRVLKSWPPAEAAPISSVRIEGTARRLLVEGDRALVYSSLPGPAGPGAHYSECTYGYACDFTGDGHPTKITILDITDRSAPKVVRELHLSGSYLSSRRIGKAVHTVVTSPSELFEGLSYYPDDLYLGCGMSASESEIREAFAALERENERIINETELQNWMPTIRDKRGEGTVAKDVLVECRGFYRSRLGDGNQFTTLLSLDIAADKPVNASTIVSRPGAVYASADALYMAVPRERMDEHSWWAPSNPRQVSAVHKFRLDNKDAKSSYVASGAVKGRVLNQFAMDEHQGHLRIATTTGHVPSPKVHSTLTVLRSRGGQLVETGRIDQIAPTEDIRSVRFDGDRGYVVTFKKTDPLFVFDLSDPNDPKQRAELKIPGFSTYMQMMDSKHLLTVGYDADDQGSFAWFTGVRLQIFDVADATNPQLKHVEVIGTRGSSSEALTNHLAVNYFGPKNLLALPMTVCEDSSGGGSYGMQMTFSGLMVFDTTASAGFMLRGKIDHIGGYGTDAQSCNTWWTEARSTVKRSIVMDDYVYSVSGELIRIAHLSNLSSVIASIPISN